MSRINNIDTDKLSSAERRQLQAQAKKAGMTVDEWVEFFTKAKIYEDSLEALAASRTTPQPAVTG